MIVDPFKNPDYYRQPNHGVNIHLSEQDRADVARLAGTTTIGKGKAEIDLAASLYKRGLLDKLTWIDGVPHFGQSLIPQEA